MGRSPSSFWFEFYGRGEGTHKELVFLRSRHSMQDDPHELFMFFGKKNRPAWDRYNKKFKMFLEGNTQTGQQCKPIVYKGTRWHEFKDNSSQTRMFFYMIAFDVNGSKRTACIIFSGFDKKKEDDIADGHMIRAKNRIAQFVSEIESGSLRLGGWNDEK